MKFRLFGANLARRAAPAGALPWLAPVTGMLCLLFVSLGLQPSGAEAPDGPGSGERPAAWAQASYAGGAALSRLNGVPAARIEWTTGSRFPSQSALRALAGTNTLKP